MGTENKKPITVARTQLKVSRSLDPSTMQTVNVLTKDGSVAQLIVKRRDGKSQSATTPSSTTLSDQPKPNVQTNWVPINALKVENEFFNSQKSQIGNQIFHKDTETKVPKPVTIRSGNVFVKVDEPNKRGRSIMSLGSDGIPVIHGVRVPDDESDKVKVWRNARVVNGELIPYTKEDGSQKPTTEGKLIYATESYDDEAGKNIGPFTTADNYGITSTQSGPSIGPFTIDDVRPSRGNYVRFSSDTGFGPFTKNDNARFANAKLIDYIKKINEQESKRDYFSGRRQDEQQNDNHQIQRRMLQYSGHHNYPNSLLYTPTTTKLSRVNFNEGVRTPVLQYAHPELGVQPAKVPSEEDIDIKQNNRKNMYTYTQDFNGRNPYVVDANDYMHSGRNSDRPNGYYNDQNDYYKRPEMNYNTYSGNYYRIKEPMPFWMRISESLKDNLHYGVSKMQQIARPVIGPIVEATQKIGQNLGLVPQSPYRMIDEAQDKIEVAAPAALGGSVILPALGLVAGGAALGLGAAAVGRFLDVGNMRSAHDTFVDEAEMQHKRALERYGTNGDYVVIMETNTKLNEDNSVRKRRSVPYEEKFLDDIIQSVEHDTKNTALGSHLIGNSKWADTPCSKRMFCDIMTRQSFEQIAFMEKKIDSYLSMLHPVLVSSVSQHLQEVMSAVKRHDCSRFVCHTPSM